MKAFLLSILMLTTLTCGDLFAQKVEYKVVEVTAVVGLKGPQLIGDYIFVAKDSRVDQKQVTLVKTDVNADVEVMTDKNQPMIPVDLGDGIYLFETPGTYFVRLEVLDWDKRERRKTLFKLEVKGGVKPVPPDAQWKQTLKELGPFVARVSKQNRSALTSTLRGAADGIASNKFLRQSDASKYIRDNKPSSPAIDALMSQLTQSAKRDQAKGLQTVTAYYRELASYIDPAPAPQRRKSVSKVWSPEPKKSSKSKLSFMPKNAAPYASQPVPLPQQSVICEDGRCYVPTSNFPLGVQ